MKNNNVAGLSLERQQINDSITEFLLKHLFFS